MTININGYSVTDEQTGCWIDGGHMNPDDFSLEIINQAHSLVNWDFDSTELPDKDNSDYGQIVHDISLDAIDAINEKTDGGFFTVDESCLVLEQYPDINLGWCCVDCMMIIANGDDTDLDPDRATLIRSCIDEFDGRILLGHNSVDFSINQCNVCHSELAGYRNSVLFDMDTVNS